MHSTQCDVVKWTSLADLVSSDEVDKVRDAMLEKLETGSPACFLPGPGEDGFHDSALVRRTGSMSLRELASDLTSRKSRADGSTWDGLEAYQRCVGVCMSRFETDAHLIEQAQDMLRTVDAATVPEDIMGDIQEKADTVSAPGGDTFFNVTALQDSFAKCEGVSKTIKVLIHLGERVKYLVGTSRGPEVFACIPHANCPSPCISRDCMITIAILLTGTLAKTERDTSFGFRVDGKRVPRMELADKMRLGKASHFPRIFEQHLGLLLLCEFAPRNVYAFEDSAAARIALSLSTLRRDLVVAVEPSEAELNCLPEASRKWATLEGAEAL